MKFKAITSKLFLLITLFTLGSAFVQAQSRKNVKISSIDAVKVSAGINLILTQSNSENARIEANADYINDVVLEISGKELSIKWKKQDGFFSNFNNREATVFVNYIRLNDLSASSGSNIKTTNTLKSNKVSVSVSSGAHVNIALTANNLTIKTSSGSNAILAGTANNISVDSSSGSTVSALNLLTDYARTEASSGANIKVSVRKGIEAKASSGGNINYKGNAALNKKGTSKSGNVSKIG